MTASAAVAAQNFPAREARKKVAHGATVGFAITKVPAPAGAAEKWHDNFFRPIRGLMNLRLITHGCTVGYYRTLLRSFKGDSGTGNIFKKAGK